MKKILITILLALLLSGISLPASAALEAPSAVLSVEEQIAQLRAEIYEIQRQIINLLSQLISLYSQQLQPQINELQGKAEMIQLPAPVIDSLTPSAAFMGERGIWFTLRGQNFQEGAKVFFGNSPRGEWSVNDAGDLKNRQPHQIGTYGNDFAPGNLYNVRVMNPEGKEDILLNGFEVLPAMIESKHQYLESLKNSDPVKYQETLKKIER